MLCQFSAGKDQIKTRVKAASKQPYGTCHLRGPNAHIAYFVSKTIALSSAASYKLQLEHDWRHT